MRVCPYDVLGNEGGRMRNGRGNAPLGIAFNRNPRTLFYDSIEIDKDSRSQQLIHFVDTDGVLSRQALHRGGLVGCVMIVLYRWVALLPT